MGLAALLIPLFKAAGFDPNRSLLLLTLATLAALAGLMSWRPALDGESAVRRCVWLIGAFTLLNQNLFSWYLLWLLPLIAIFLELRPAHVTTLIDGASVGGLRADGWTGWWLFCGLVALSYTFFITWQPNQ